jgi:hypothetical protein
MYAQKPRSLLGHIYTNLKMQGLIAPESTAKGVAPNCCVWGCLGVKPGGVWGGLLVDFEGVYLENQVEMEQVEPFFYYWNLNASIGFNFDALLAG